MPFFLSALLGGLVRIAGTVAGQVLIGLGISVVTYVGVQSTMDGLMAFSVQKFQSLPPSLIGLLAVLRVGEFISMVAAAVVTRMGIQGMKNGAMKTWVKK